MFDWGAAGEQHTPCLLGTVLDWPDLPSGRGSTRTLGAAGWELLTQVTL